MLLLVLLACLMFICVEQQPDAHSAERGYAVFALGASYLWQRLLACLQASLPANSAEHHYLYNLRSFVM